MKWLPKMIFHFQLISPHLGGCLTVTVPSEPWWNCFNELWSRQPAGCNTTHLAGTSFPTGCRLNLRVKLERGFGMWWVTVDPLNCGSTGQWPGNWSSRLWRWIIPWILDNQSKTIPCHQMELYSFCPWIDLNNASISYSSELWFVLPQITMSIPKFCPIAPHVYNCGKSNRVLKGLTLHVGLWTT